jgi:hypothetical protein
VALFGISGVDMTSIAFVETSSLLKAGHAAHPRCYVALASWRRASRQEFRSESGGIGACLA